MDTCGNTERSDIARSHRSCQSVSVIAGGGASTDTYSRLMHRPTRPQEIVTWMAGISPDEGWTVGSMSLGEAIARCGNVGTVTRTRSCYILITFPYRATPHRSFDSAWVRWSRRSLDAPSILQKPGSTLSSSKNSPISSGDCRRHRPPSTLSQGLLAEPHCSHYSF